MRRSASAIWLLLGCACGASAGVSRPTSTTIDIRSMGAGGGSVTISPGSGPNVNTINAAVNDVWKVLPAAFDSVGVPVTHIDPASRSIGNEGFKVRQRLGKLPLSRSIDCGQTQIGPNADSYDVYVTLIVQAIPVGAGTRLVTTFEASARPVTFSQAYSRCSSRGSLEGRLIDAVTAQLK